MSFLLRPEPPTELSFIPDEPVAHPFMTGFEYLMMLATLKRVRLAHQDTELLERFHIDLARHLQFKDMSLGTQRKFMLAGGMLGKPAVLLMDEPTNGLDAAAKDTLAALIDARRHDTLVLFSTHDQAFAAATRASVLALPVTAAGPDGTGASASLATQAEQPADQPAQGWAQKRSKKSPANCLTGPRAQDVDRVINTCAGRR